MLMTVILIAIVAACGESDEDAATPAASGSQPVTAEEEIGLPLPDDHTGFTSEGGEFRRMVTVYSPSDVATLSKFYQTELKGRGWTLDVIERTLSELEDAPSEQTLRFIRDVGELVVTIRFNALTDEETKVVLVQRDRAAAEAAGVLPPAGQARLYLVNITESGMTVTIDGQTVEVPPGPGTESPKDAPQLDVPPGEYDVTTVMGGSSATDEIVVSPDESWALLLNEEGARPVRVY